MSLYYRVFPVADVPRAPQILTYGTCTIVKKLDNFTKGSVISFFFFFPSFSNNEIKIQEFQGRVDRFLHLDPSVYSPAIQADFFFF